MNQLVVPGSPRRARGHRLGGLLGALLLLTSCGGGDDAESGAADGLVITITGLEYEVPESVPAGAEVTVRNVDSIAHTVTSDEDGLFDVFVEGGGNEVTFTVPDEPGSYGFYCIPHPGMTDTLVVG